MFRAKAVFQQFDQFFGWLPGKKQSLAFRSHCGWCCSRLLYLGSMKHMPHVCVCLCPRTGIYNATFAFCSWPCCTVCAGKNSGRLYVSAISTMTTNSGIYWCLAMGHWLKHYGTRPPNGYQCVVPKPCAHPRNTTTVEVRSVQHEFLVGKCSNNMQ